MLQLRAIIAGYMECGNVSFCRESVINLCAQRSLSTVTSQLKTIWQNNVPVPSVVGCVVTVYIRAIIVKNANLYKNTERSIGEYAIERQIIFRTLWYHSHARYWRHHRSPLKLFIIWLFFLCSTGKSWKWRKNRGGNSLKSFLLSKIIVGGTESWV